VLRHPIGRTMIEQSVTKIFLANPEAVREEYVDGFGLTQAEFDIVRSLGAQGGRRFLVKQGHASAICELDLAGLEDFITVLSATTDNVALLDAVRERHGNDPFQWLPCCFVRFRIGGFVPPGEPHESCSSSPRAGRAGTRRHHRQRPVRQGQRGRQGHARWDQEGRDATAAGDRTHSPRSPAPPTLECHGGAWHMVETKAGFVECTEAYARPTALAGHRPTATRS
jgi:hypothetical protein